MPDIASFFSEPSTGAARAYDALDLRYAVYADGPDACAARAGAETAFDGRYGCADREVWRQIDEILTALVLQGRRSLRVLDVGCGPGTWLRRVVLRAAELGFDRIRVRGFDVSTALCGRAAAVAADLTGLLPRDRLGIVIETGDATRPLPEASGTIDLCLCLYGVLNHLPVASLPEVAAELARVTCGHLVVTARAAGSLPTIYVDGLEAAHGFRQDNLHDRLEVDLVDGRHLSLPSHLFRAEELQMLFMPHVLGSTVRGLDLFHGRFRRDPRWNPDLPGAEAFVAQIDRLERFYACEPGFIDRASHIMLTAACMSH